MKVTLMPYDPEWSERFELRASAIRTALGDELLIIEHVGSTSVTGLSAKPIIDIVIAVRDSGDESLYVPALEAIGYHVRVREPDWYEHRVLRNDLDDTNLHVFTAGCDEIDRMVTFRDRLRSSEPYRLRYETLKQDLAKREWDSIQDYANAKGEMIEDILAGA